VTAGVRWDFDGPLTEKYGRLTAFNPSLVFYDTSATRLRIAGLEIAGNNATFATACASDSLLQKHQWGFAPRIGWLESEAQLTVACRLGIYYDRGELFRRFFPVPDSGFNVRWV